MKEEKPKVCKKNFVFLIGFFVVYIESLPKRSLESESELIPLEIDPSLLL